MLATQGSSVQRVFMVQEGEVSFVLEGSGVTNPMNPSAGGPGEAVQCISYLAAGSAAAMKAAVCKQNSFRDRLQGDIVGNRCAWRRLTLQGLSRQH